MKTIVSKLIVTLMISCCLSYTNATSIQEEQENTSNVQPSNHQKPIDPEIIFTSDYSLKILEEEPSNLYSLAKLSKKTHDHFKPQIQSITWAYNHFQSQLQLTSRHKFVEAICFDGFKRHDNADPIFKSGFVKHIFGIDYPMSVLDNETKNEVKEEFKQKVSGATYSHMKNIIAKLFSEQLQEILKLVPELANNSYSLKGNQKFNWINIFRIMQQNSEVFFSDLQNAKCLTTKLNQYLTDNSNQILPFLSEYCLLMKSNLNEDIKSNFARNSKLLALHKNKEEKFYSYVSNESPSNLMMVQDIRINFEEIESEIEHLKETSFEIKEINDLLAKKYDLLEKLKLLNRLG